MVAVDYFLLAFWLVVVIVLIEVLRLAYGGL